MANRFYQIDLRLARARKNLTELQSLADEFASTTMKSVTFKQNDYREPFYTSAEEFEVLGEVEAGELQVIIDDFVQNLRAALNFYKKGQSVQPLVGTEMKIVELMAKIRNMPAEPYASTTAPSPGIGSRLSVDPSTRP